MTPPGCTGTRLGLVNSRSILHAPAPHGCPLGASCASLPDCTIKPRQLPEEPRWLPAMSAQCQVADILVGASFKESEAGYKKTGREDVELECVMMGFNEYHFFDHKVLSLCWGAELKKGGLWKWKEVGSDLYETYPCQGAARKGEVRKFLLGPLDSISFDLPANPDWVRTRAAHPSCFYTAVSVPRSHKALWRRGRGIKKLQREKFKKKKNGEKNETDKVTASKGGGSKKQRGSCIEFPRHKKPVNSQWPLT